MNNEDELQRMYRAVEQATSGGDPLVVAGIFMAQAIKIYKTVLHEDEFNQVTDYILNNKDNIEIENPTLQ
tara:strand:+ start:97 stop:306 length:210 start_codon:yes stop_codon:yes gene_type:complete